MKDYELNKIQADFTEVYEQMASQIYNYLLNLCKCPLQAEELLQETFFAVYKNIKTLKKEAAIKSWVYKIATNKFYDHLRKERRELIINSELVDIQPCTSASPSQLAMQNEQIQALRQAIDALPPKLKTTLILVRFEGMKYKQAAEVLGVSIATVRMQLHRSMKILTRKLGEINDE